MTTTAKRVFDPMVEAGARAYRRERDLPRIIPIGPDDLEDYSIAGTERVLEKLSKSLSAQREIALRGHWSYDMNLHLALLSAWQAEFNSLKGMSQ